MQNAPGSRTPKKNLNDRKIDIPAPPEARGSALHETRKKSIFPSLTFFFIQVARLARGGDAAPSFHPKAPLILYLFLTKSTMVL